MDHSIANADKIAHGIADDIAHRIHHLPRVVSYYGEPLPAEGAAVAGIANDILAQIYATPHSGVSRAVVSVLHALVALNEYGRITRDTTTDAHACGSALEDLVAMLPELMKNPELQRTDRHRSRYT